MCLHWSCRHSDGSSSLFIYNLVIFISNCGGINHKDRILQEREREREFLLTLMLKSENISFRNKREKRRICKVFTNVKRKRKERFGFIQQLGEGIQIRAWQSFSESIDRKYLSYKKHCINNAIILRIVCNLRVFTPNYFPAGCHQTELANIDFDYCSFGNDSELRKERRRGIFLDPNYGQFESCFQLQERANWRNYYEKKTPPL